VNQLGGQRGPIRAVYQGATELRPVEPYPYLLIEKTELRPADAILVFGNIHIIEQSARMAAKLHREGLAPLIIASGGVRTSAGETEAAAITRVLRGYNDLQPDIIAEHKSTNSQENVLNARALLCNRPIRSVIAVGTVVAGRRFLMTLAQNWPEVTPMFVPVNPYGVPARAWQTEPAFEKKAWSELAKIPNYIKAGYIKEIDLDDLDRRIRLLPDNRVKIPAMERAPL